MAVRADRPRIARPAAASARAAQIAFVFISERGASFSRRGFQAMLERAGEAAGFDMKIHPHMLRHACGFKLANEGVGYPHDPSLSRA